MVAGSKVEALGAEAAKLRRDLLLLWMMPTQLRRIGSRSS